ncbi:MAG: hypothetical protein OEY16_05425, partial [Alphaproteobacteria bacterium]|nr:hypothetical protein [Alphaproteobacteria bacterium]
MTLSSTNTKVIYNGDGATSEFAIGFVFWNSDDLRVIHRDAGGTETVWARGTHYTVSGGAGATGTLTVRTTPTDYTPAAGESLTIKDAQPEVQGDSLPLSGAFPSTVVEQRLDRLTRLIQIHSEEIARSVLLPETASLSGLRIPEPGAGELVRYNPAGTSLETVKAGDLSLGVDTLLTGLATNDFLRWDNAQGAWVNITPGATGLALFQDETPAAARAELALGTAALANIGVAAGNVPAMDATGYPAADGSRITNLSPGNVTAGIAPRGYIDGLILSNNAIDVAHDIDIAPGVARDGGDAANLALSSVLTKRTDASWAEGNSQGGLDGTESVIGTPGANTWYHVWLIRRSDSGAVDALFSESATIPAMPVNYDQKRRIGAILTDGAGNVVEFYQGGDRFYFKDGRLDLSGNPGTVATLHTVSTPLGIKVRAIFAIRVVGTAGGQFGKIWSPDI